MDYKLSIRVLHRLPFVVLKYLIPNWPTCKMLIMWKFDSGISHLVSFILWNLSVAKCWTRKMKYKVFVTQSIVQSDDDSKHWMLFRQKITWLNLLQEMKACWIPSFATLSWISIICVAKNNIHRGFVEM